MTTRKLPELILIVAVMLMAIGCLLVPLSALATEREHKPTPRPTQPAHSTSSASIGAIDVSLMNMPGDVTMRSGNVYSLAAPAMAAPLPPGLCPRNHSMSVAPLGGLLFSYSESSTGTDYDCLKMVLAHLREVAEIGARPAVVNYISNYAAPVAECQKPKVKRKPAALEDCKKRRS